MSRASLLVAVAVTVGCGAPPLSDLCGDASCASQRTIENAFQRTTNLSLDLLFIIDDTSAIAPYHADLLGALPTWAQTLGNIPGLSLQAGVVSATSCAAPPTTRAAACGLPAPGSFLTSHDCGQTNFAGPLDGELSCLADLGTAGCPPAAPLAAVRSLLAAPAPAPGWETFLRPTAYLMIVVVAAEDDASGFAVSALVDDLRGLKADPDYQIFVSIVGPADGPATAPRFTELAQSFGNNGRYDTIGAAGLGGALTAIAWRPEPIGPLCLDGVRDTDPATPGMQADCAVEDVLRSPDGTSVATVLASCDSAPPPCWRISPGTPGGGCDGLFTFSVDRGPDYCPASNFVTRFECLGCLDPADPACAPPPP